MKSALKIEFPESFEDELTKAKGWLSGVQVRDGAATYTVTFYDPVRLAQDVESELEAGSIFVERNVIVLSEVDRESIEDAVHKIGHVGVSKYLAVDGSD